MIKAVFFDLYHTLVGYKPPREQLQAEAANVLGFDSHPEDFRRPITLADEFFYEEMSKTPLSKRTEAERQALWFKYQNMVMEAAGFIADAAQIKELLRNMTSNNMRLALFDDVLPVVSELKNMGKIVGLISNVDRDVNQLLAGVGMPPLLLDVIVTSEEAGVSKPHPGIFREALKRAGVTAEQAVYVGDQYQIDILGAKSAGLAGVLLDRQGHYKHITDCPRVESMAELSALLAASA
ncbi:HAD family hydrolase [Chloroflexota bacterium]